MQSSRWSHQRSQHQHEVEVEDEEHHHVTHWLHSVGARDNSRLWSEGEGEDDDEFPETVCGTVCNPSSTPPQFKTCPDPRATK